ncbi:MAG: prephenate dehydratase [Pseudomonadota bacterium]
MACKPPPLLPVRGEPGAYSHLACVKHFPDHAAEPCATFEDAFAAVFSRRADLAMLPIENSLAGRVADIHHLLPNSGLYIVGERFLRVRHQLMARKGVALGDLKTVHSHTMALGQCRQVIRTLGLRAVVEADTAGSARRLSETGAASEAAIASSLAAEIYGLQIVKPDVEDASHNTTRFLVMAADPDDMEPGTGAAVTTFVFRVRNIPSALYKAMGGFATNGVNMTKLESYQLDGAFTATQFYADIEGHPNDEPVRLALEELKFFSSALTILGVYPADPYRDGRT